MGLIRKKPGQKVNILPKFEITPAKFWVSVSLLFLFLSAFSWMAGDFIAKAELFDKQNMFAAIEDGSGSSSSSSSAGEIMQDPCKKAEQEGLSVICGTVKSARIENKDGYLTNNEPLENVTVAVYEAMPDSPTGKTADGSLGHLFASTVTNSEGQYRIKAREFGPGQGNIYIAYLCNGRVAALKRTKSANNISNFPVHINCGGDLAEPEIPPAELAYVNRTGNILSCLTNPLKNTAEDPTEWKNVNAPKEVAVFDTPSPTIQGRVVEENFDFRYLSRDKAEDELNIGNRILGLSDSEGAFWKNDCEAKGKEFCSSSEMDPQDYRTRNLLEFIPEEPTDDTYRTKDIRFNFKQTNIDPVSMFGYFKAVYGDVADAFIGLQSQDEDTSPQLISCDDLENSKNTIAESDFNLKNTKLTVSPGLGLSSPYSCEEKLDLLDEDDLDFPACQPAGNNDPLTWKDIMDDPELKEKYFRCDQLVMKGGVIYSEYYSGVETDSGDSDLRDDFFGFFDGAASNPYNTQTNAIIPGTQPQKALDVAGLTSGENSLNVVDSPYKDFSGDEDEEGGDSQSTIFQQSANQEDIVVWDIGTQNMPNCAVSSIVGELGEKIGTETEFTSSLSNFFDALEQHFSNDIAGAASFTSEDARIRDEYLNDRGSETGSVPMARRDYTDSILRAAAEREKIDGSTVSLFDLFTAGLEAVFPGNDIKVFGDRVNTDSDGNALYSVQVAPQNLKIEYPLNDTNFEEFFPAYGEEGYPGEHPHYPWRELDEGETCNVYGGVSGSVDERIRTCKVTDCEITEEIPLRDPITKEIILDPETGEPETQTERRDCTTPEEESCLLGNPTANTSTCDVEEAGPYSEALEFRTGFTATVKDGDESLFNTNVPIGVDVLSVESAELSNAFVSPYSERVTERKLATMDVDYSGSESDLGKTGYDIAEPTGGVPEHMYTISASPTSRTTEDFNEINYHCNISFEGEGSVDSSQVIIPDSSYSWDCPVVVLNTCSGEAWEELEGMPTPDSIQPEAISDFLTIQNNYYSQYPELMDAYAYGEQQTGIPCEIFAGIHFVEGGSNPLQGLEEGQPIGEGELRSSVLNAASLLRQAAQAEVDNGNINDAALDDFQTIVAAMSTYNASGNQQCWTGPTAFGCPIPDTQYRQDGKCPPSWYAEDSMYALNWIDEKHRNMSLRYCSDATESDPCEHICRPPQIWERPGAMTVATMLHAVSSGN